MDRAIATVYSQPMKSLWNKEEAAACKDELELRAYTSQLLGRNSDLVLHGGGNTSLKGLHKNIFGEEIPTLFVKGSGWDLKSIKPAGFSPCRVAVAATPPSKPSQRCPTQTF